MKTFKTLIWLVSIFNSVLFGTEVVKAMGIKSGLGLYPTEIKSQNNDWDGKRLDWHQQISSQLKWGQYVGYVLTPFDALMGAPIDDIGLTSNADEIQDVYNSVSGIAKSMLPFDYNPNRNTSLEEPTTNAEDLNLLLQSPHLISKLSDKSTIPLSNKTLGLFSETLQQSPEFLMADGPLEQFNLASKMKTFNMSSLLGPLTLKLMQDIGWPIRKRPKFNKLVPFAKADKYFTYWDSTELGLLIPH